MEWCPFPFRSGCWIGVLLQVASKRSSGPKTLHRNHFYIVNGSSGQHSLSGRIAIKMMSVFVLWIQPSAKLRQYEVHHWTWNGHQQEMIVHVNGEWCCIADACVCVTNCVMCCYVWKALNNCSESRSMNSVSLSGAEQHQSLLQMRFHSCTRYDGVTFNCCRKCHGDVHVV